MAVQFAKKMGAKVIAVSRDDWVKDFGADYISNEYDKVVEKVKEITRGKMAYRKGWHASCSYSVNGCRLQTGQQRTLVVLLLHISILSQLQLPVCFTTILLEDQNSHKDYPNVKVYN